MSVQKQNTNGAPAANARPRGAKKRHFRPSSVLIHLCLLLLVAINIFPLYWMMTFSLKSGKDPVNEIQGYNQTMEATRWEEIRAGVADALTGAPADLSDEQLWARAQAAVTAVVGDLSDIEWTAIRGAIQSSLENRIKKDDEIAQDDRQARIDAVTAELDDGWDGLAAAIAGVDGLFAPDKTDDDWARLRETIEGLVAEALPSNTTPFTFTDNKWKRVVSAVERITAQQAAGIDDAWGSVRQYVLDNAPELIAERDEAESPAWAGLKDALSLLMGDQKATLDAPRTVYVPPNLVGLPRQWTWSNYASAMKTGNMGLYFLNSLVVSVCAIAITIIAAFMATYAMTRLVWRGRKMMNRFFMLGLTIPIHAAIVPVYIILSRMKLLDTYVALILPYSAFSLAMAILISVGFMGDIPYDLDEAAFIDGVGVWGIFFKIILPLMMPAISTVGIYTFLQCWNELLFANIFVSSGNFRTLPVGVQQLFGRYTTDWGPIGAALCIATIPTLIVYILLSKKIQAGFIAGAVKG